MSRIPSSTPTITNCCFCVADAETAPAMPLAPAETLPQPHHEKLDADGGFVRAMVAQSLAKKQIAVEPRAQAAVDAQ